MKREIRFRWWCNICKKMFSDKDCFIVFQNGCVIETDGCTHIEKELMQFTGLLDVQGKEIYESDIVRYKMWGGEMDIEKEKIKYSDYNTKEIVFDNGQFYPIPKYGECEDNYYSYELFDFEIIGNIYENPELLKSEGEDK